MPNTLFDKFCIYVDDTIFPKENSGEMVAFIVDQAFIDDFCKKNSVSEKGLMQDVRRNLVKSAAYGHLHVKGILAIQLFAATKREDSGDITERNYRDRLSQVLLNWDMQDLQRWMSENQEGYWERLYNWCRQNDFRIARCSPKTGAGRYVQYPVQQAERVFTQKDLKHIAYYFAVNNLLPGEDLSEKEFWRILNRRRLPSYVRTHHGQRLIENPEYLSDAYRQVFNFYLRWDGSYLDIHKKRTLQKEQHFLYLSEDGHIDIRDKDMKLEKRVSWGDLSSDNLSSWYTFKRKKFILFRKSEDYDGYWEETRYIEGHEPGIAIVFQGGSTYYGFSGTDPISYTLSRRVPVFSNHKIKIYQFGWSSELDELYTEKRFFSLEGGLKVGRMQFMTGGAPVLVIEKESRFWIDGEESPVKPVNGRLALNFLGEGYHDIKFPNFKKLEFSIVKPKPIAPVWDESFKKWCFARKPAKWASAMTDQGVCGLDYSCFHMDSSARHSINGTVITRWATLHTTGKISSKEDNIALRLLKQQ